MKVKDYTEVKNEKNLKIPFSPKSPPSQGIDAYMGMPVKILDIKDIEDCVDGSYIKEILLDGEVTKDFIQYLGKMGRMQYFPDFTRPFFKISAEGMALKGVENNKTIQAIIFETQKLEFLKKMINKYK